MAGDLAWRDALTTWGILLVSAPFFRYLIGMLLVDTGSVLAAGVMHASFNASGALPVLSDGGWQYVQAMIALTMVVAAYRRRKGKSLVEGYAEGLLPAGARSMEQPSNPPADRRSFPAGAATRETES